MTKGEFSKSYNKFSQLEPTENAWKTVGRNSVGLKFYRKKGKKNHNSRFKLHRKRIKIKGKKYCEVRRY